MLTSGPELYINKNIKYNNIQYLKYFNIANIILNYFNIICI